MDAIRTPVFDLWMSGLRDLTVKAQVLVRIKRLEGGNTGDSRPVGSGVSEMRIHVGAGHRVYYVQHGINWVILSGGDKSSQPRDIPFAIALAKNL